MKYLLSKIQSINLVYIITIISLNNLYLSKIMRSSMSYQKIENLKLYLMKNCTKQAKRKTFDYTKRIKTIGFNLKIIQNYFKNYLLRKG